MVDVSEWTTADFLLYLDKERERSQQAELGMSELGGCEKRAGFRLNGVTPTDDGTSLQAVMGTVLHESAAKAFKIMQERGLIPPEDEVEREVRFAGVLGHFDRYNSVKYRVHDTKSTSQHNLDRIILEGPPTSHKWQGHLYGAALIAEGKKVRDIELDYLARDTGNTHQVVLKFEPQHVRDALQWLDTVRSTPLEFLNRGYAPDSAWCAHCPFRTACWGDALEDRDARSVLFLENPDAAKWAQQLEDGRRMEREGKKLAKEASGALDALRPNEKGNARVDVGLPDDRELSYTVQSATSVDQETVKADYEKAGMPVPTKTTKFPVVRIVKKPKPKKGKK